MRPCKALATCLVCFALGAVPASAADLELREDGWYRWEVPAGRAGLKACCYEVRSGFARKVACRLGDGKNEFSPQGDCELDSGSMQIFVRVSNGQVDEIQALSSACPVHADSKIHTIADVSSAESIAWLRAQVDENPRVIDAAIMTLSFHGDEQGLETLFEILEDTGQRRSAREQALFWLVQSDSDEAYAYLDRLLD